MRKLVFGDTSNTVSSVQGVTSIPVEVDWGDSNSAPEISWDDDAEPVLDDNAGISWDENPASCNDNEIIVQHRLEDIQFRSDLTSDFIELQCFFAQVKSYTHTQFRCDVFTLFCGSESLRCTRVTTFLLRIKFRVHILFLPNTIHNPWWNCPMSFGR